MNRLRRLPLGVRLGAAFAVLLVALAATVLVGVTNLRALNVKDADSAQGKDIVAARIVTDLGESIHSSAHLTVRHLYVFDGDLEAEDAIAARMRASDDRMRAATKQLTPTLHTERSRKAFAEVGAAGARFGKLVGDAIARSRKETLARSEDRDGSRAIYTDKIVPLMDRTLVPAMERLEDSIAADTKGDRLARVGAVLGGGEDEADEGCEH